MSQNRPTKQPQVPSGQVPAQLQSQPQVQAQNQPPGQQPGAPGRVPLEYSFSRYFIQWLASNGISIALTTYQTGHLMFIGVNSQGQLTSHGRGFQRAMGLHATPQRLYMSTINTLLRFDNILANGEVTNDFDRLYVPRVAHVTGDLDIHDIVVDKAGRVIFANTLHSCLATISNHHSFKPIWRPPFISKLTPEDRCHLNGLAMVDGEARYVTMISRSDATSGWRDRRWEGGMIMDIQSNEIVTQNLSMPHSPRFYQDKLWVLNSGTGYFGYVDMDSGIFQEVAFCPGYMRGLAFHKHFAIIGLSMPRIKAFSELPLDKNLQAKDVDAKCGLVVVDLNTGNIPHWFYFEKGVTELYDVQVLAGIRSPIALDFNSADINQLITVENPDAPLDQPYKHQGGGILPPLGMSVTYRYRLSQDMTSAAARSDFAPLVFPPLEDDATFNEPMLAVAAGDGRGFVGLIIAELTDDGSTAQIISLHVLPEHQRRGVAKGLLANLEQALKEANCQELILAYNADWESVPALQRLHAGAEWAAADNDDSGWQWVRKNL
jgi:uncharacterized protein (TIGR03032 family)